MSLEGHGEECLKKVKIQFKKQKSGLCELNSTPSNTNRPKLPSVESLKKLKKGVP
jgi:hypothetical protein